MAREVPWWTLIPAALFAGVAVWAIGPGVSGPDTQKILVQFPGGGSIEVDSRRQTLEHGALLERLFETDFGRNGVLGWLRDRQRVYRIDSTDLVDALHRGICDPIPPAPLEQRLSSAAECAAKPVVAALRRLSDAREVPFHYVGDRVLAGIQSDTAHRPGSGRANVCRPGPYVGRTLQVTDLATGRAIEVEATGTYRCTLGSGPAIQLDPADAHTLFQRPTARLEQVIVVLL